MEFYKGVQEPATSQIWLYPIEDGNFECRVYGSKGWKPVTTVDASADYREVRALLDNKADHGYPSVPKTLKQVDDSKEDLANKQSNLAVDGTNTKYPTVDAINTGLSTKLDTTAVKQVTGASITDVMSQKAITDILVTKADHGYTSNPKSLKQVEDLKENSANKQNNLNADGTGTKFPTVDAVNSGLASIVNNSAKLLGVYEHTSNTILPQISSIDYSTSTITFETPHGFSTVPRFYSQVVFAVVNDYNIKTNYKAVPSGFRNNGSLRLVEIISPTTLRLSINGDLSNYVTQNTDPSFVDFSMFHLEYCTSTKVNINFEDCKAIKVVMLINTQQGQLYVDALGNWTSTENKVDVGTILGLGNAVVEKYFYISGNGLLTQRTSGTGNSILGTGFSKVTYDTIYTYKAIDISAINGITCDVSFPKFANGTKFIIYKIA